MNCRILMLFLTIILLSITASAYTNYQTPGYQKYNPWYSDGTLPLNSSTALLIPGTLTLKGGTPLIEDLDHDGSNEVVIIDTNDILYVQNFTGTSFSNLASTVLGSPNRYGQTLRYTPGIIDYDLDLSHEIVVANGTHLLVYNYTLAGGLTLEESASIPTTNSTGTFTDAGAFLTVKCSVAGNYNGDKVCYVRNINKVGVTYDMMLLEYDLTTNTVLNATIGPALWASYAPQQYRQPLILDVNSDGIQECLSGMYDAGNGVMRVVIAEQTAADTLSFTVPHNLTTTAGYWISDITAGNLDGIVSNGEEIGLFYRANSTNKYAGRIINRVGSVLNTFTLTDSITNAVPATNLATVNNLEDYCAFIQYSSTATLTCMSGNSNTFSSVYGSTAGYNSTGGTFSIVDQFSNAQGILTGGFAAKFTNHYPFLVGWYTDLPDTNITPFHSTLGFTHSISVDARLSGVEDVLLSNTTTYAILNTLGTNQAPVIVSYGTGTGMPSCQYVVQKYHIILSDAESDLIRCHLGYYYVNDTIISEEVKTGSSGVQFEFLKTLDDAGSFKATLKCGDTYHPNITSQTILQTVSNATGCYSQDVGGTTTEVSANETAAADADWDTTTEDLYSSLGVSSKKAKNLLALFLVMLVAVLIYIKTQSGLLSVASIPVTMLIAFFANLASIFPVIVLLLCVVFLIVWTVMKGAGGSGQPGG